MLLQFKRTSTMGERIISFLIDHFIFTIIFMIGIFNVISTSVEKYKLIWVFILAFAMLLIYSFKDIVEGRSLGKRVVCIAVRCIENHNEVPNRWKLFLRNITLVIWPIEFFIIMFNPDGIRLGDILAKTIVVKVEKTDDEHNEVLNEFKIRNENNKSISRKKVWKVTAIAIVIFIAVIISFIGGIGSIMKNNGAYKITVAQIEKNEKIADQIGKIKGYGFMPTGSVSIENGYGTADLLIKVKGEKRDIRVHSKLYKEPNAEWQIEQFDIID